MPTYASNAVSCNRRIGSNDVVEGRSSSQWDRREGHNDLFTRSTASSTSCEDNVLSAGNDDSEGVLLLTFVGATRGGRVVAAKTLSLLSEVPSEDEISQRAVGSTRRGVISQQSIRSSPSSREVIASNRFNLEEVHHRFSF